MSKLFIPTSGFSDSESDEETVPVQALIAEELIGPIREREYYVYSLHSGTTLFRGSKNPRKSLHVSGMTWFAFDELNASQYGTVSKYELTSNINKSLLALDCWDTLHWLYTNINESALGRARQDNANGVGHELTLPNSHFSPENIRKVLKSQFGYTPDKNKPVLRSSDPKPDLLLTKYICALGFSGYAIKQMKTYTGGNFHPEVAFCTAEHHCRYLSTVKPAGGAPMKGSPKTVMKSNKKTARLSSPDNGATPFIRNRSPRSTLKLGGRNRLFGDSPTTPTRSPLNMGSSARSRSRSPAPRSPPTRRSPPANTRKATRQLSFMNLGESSPETPKMRSPPRLNRGKKPNGSFFDKP